MFKKEKPTYQILKKNPKKGLEQMYKKYGAKLCAYAVNKWNLKEDDSWDLVYKTLYKIEKSIADYQFDNEEKFAAFVFKVFINYLRNYHRDTKKEIKTDPLNDWDTVENEKSNISDSQELKILNKELDLLEDWQRILLLLRAQGMPYSEIEKYTNKPEKQLKVYYGRLKKRIEKTLVEQLEVSEKEEVKDEA